MALARAELLNAWHGATSTTRAQRLRGLLFVGLIVTFFVAAEYLSHRVFSAFLGVGDVTFGFIALLLALRLLGILFLIVMSLLFFGGLIASIDALYFDDDIDFLASHPLTPGLILAKKLASVYATSAWVVFLIITPVMTGYGRALGLGFAHLPLSLCSLFIFSVAPVALAATAVILIMRVLPVDRAKESVLGVGVLLSFGVIYLYRLLSPRNLARPDLLMADTTKFIREFTTPLGAWMPSNRMAQALLSAAPLHYGAWLQETGALAAVALLALAAYFIVGRFFFETDRPVSGNASRPGPLESWGRLHVIARGIARCAPRGMRGLVFKEIMTNVRDPMQISHLVLIFGIVALHFANLSEIPYELHPAARVLVAFLNLGLIGFLTAAVAVRFVYPSISLEGKPFWLVETAPISAIRFVRLKFLAAWIPLTASALGIVITSNSLVGVDVGLTVIWSAATLAITTTITAVGVAIGITMPVFDRRNVFEISSSPGGIIFMLVSLLYVGVTITALAPATYDVAFGGESLYNPKSLLALTLILCSAAYLCAVSHGLAVEGIENFTESKYAG